MAVKQKKSGAKKPVGMISSAMQSVYLQAWNALMRSPVRDSKVAAQTAGKAKKPTPSPRQVKKVKIKVDDARMAKLVGKVRPNSLSTPIRAKKVKQSRHPSRKMAGQNRRREDDSGDEMFEGEIPFRHVASPGRHGDGYGHLPTCLVCKRYFYDEEPMT